MGVHRTARLSRIRPLRAVSAIEDPYPLRNLAMATVDRPRSKKQASARAPKERTKKSRAFRFGSLITLALLLVGLYLAPTIVARTPLGPWAVQSALGLDGTISFGSASLGWFSGAAADNIEIRDAQGEKVLEVASLTTDKSLLALAMNSSDLGPIQVERPIVHVVAGPTATNLERVFASLFSGQDVSNIKVQLQITDGVISIDDVPSSRQFQIEGLALDCTIADADQPLVLVASGTISDKRQPGNFKLELRSKRLAGSNQSPSGKVDCQTTDVPLEVLDPIMRRYIERATLSGRLSTRLAGAWGEMAEGGEASVRGESSVTNLVFASASLGADRIELDRVDIPCQIVQQGETIEIEKLAIQCELGQLTLSGSAKMSDLSEPKILAALAREEYKLDGHADLAQIARRLPQTLKIREDTEITSGQIDLSVISRREAAGMTWSGNIGAKQLAAQSGGRALTWSNPLAIQFETHEDKNGLVLDRAHCASSFLQIEAAGSIDDLNANATFDLARLTAELRQFSDLGGAQLAGRGQAQLAWKRGENNRFTSAAQFQSQGFQFTAAGGNAWKEDNLLAKLDLDGELQGQALNRVDRAELTVDAAGETLQARLSEPVSAPTSAAWPLECSWRGQLTNWPRRLETCAGITGWDLSGAGALQASLLCSAKSIDIAQAKAQFTQFRAWGHGCFIAEPAATLTGEGRWDVAKSRLDLAQATIAAGPTLATVSKAFVQATSAGWAIEGATAKIGADLAQWYCWRHDPRTAASLQVAGRHDAQADLKHDSGITTCRADGKIDQLQLVDLTRPTKPGAAPAVWRERQITWNASGNYVHETQLVTLEKIQLASDALRAGAAGAIPLAEQGGQVDLKGTIEYDWNQLAPLWRPYVGPNVQVAGRQSRAFSMQGRLTGSPTDSQSWKQVTGEAAIGWTGMDIAGMRVGPGEVAARLNDGQVQGQPMDVHVSEGRFTFTPFVRLNPAPAELLISRGPLLTDVHLSPEMCARGLKFVAPILAESTVAEGRFSISLDGGRIPLADPAAGDTSGRMTMKAQVKSGPVAQEFMVLLNEITSVLQRGTLVQKNDQANALLSIDTSEIEFRLVDRRVYHRGLKFMAGTLPITTHGSVGLDETLAIVAEVPIQAKLLGRDLSLGALEGQTLQIPIQGTLKKPKLDHRIVEKLTGQFLQNATRGLLLEGLNKQLDRLLPPQQ